MLEGFSSDFATCNYFSQRPKHISSDVGFKDDYGVSDEGRNITSEDSLLQDVMLLHVT